MKSRLSVAHLTQSTIGLVLGCFVAYVAIANYFEGRPDLTPGRLLLASLLTLYSAINIWVQRTNGFFYFKALLFPFFYVGIGLVIEMWWHGYIKNWAPGTKDEAFSANLFFIVVIISLIGLAALSTFYKRSLKKSALPPTPGKSPNTVRKSLS